MPESEAYNTLTGTINEFLNEIETYEDSQITSFTEMFTDIVSDFNDILDSEVAIQV